jgi:hypothetical protein
MDNTASTTDTSDRVCVSASRTIDKAHRSSVAMQRLDAGRTEVTWEASFEPVGAPANALAAGVKSGVLELGLQGLADRVRTNI